MSGYGRSWSLRCLSFALLLSVFSGQADESVETVPIAAPRSYNRQPFQYTRALRERNHRHVVYEVRYPSPVLSPHASNNTVPAELYVPVGATQDRLLPAVVCLHIIHDNFDLERLLCSRLAQCGVAAFFFKQPYYGERGGTVGKQLLATDAAVFIGGLEQGLEDARRAVDIVQSLPEVNPEHVGITGISMGAVQSAAVCGREPRIGKAFLTLGGCDIRQVIETAHETRRMRSFILGLPEAERDRVWACVERLDPIHAAGALRRLAERDGLRMVCAENDQVIPPSCGKRLAEAAGFAERVTWLAGMDHYTAMAGFPRIMDEVVAFFSADVPSSWKPPEANGGPDGFARIGGFLSGLAALAGGEPKPGTAHMVGFSGEATVGGKRHEAVCEFVRGASGRCRLTGTFPQVGRAGFGIGEYPWLMGAGSRVFCGTRDDGGPRHPSALVQEQRLMRFRVGVGALAGVALSPEALKQYYTLAESKLPGGEQAVEIRVDYKRTRGTLRWVFARDGTPREVVWDFGESSGRVRFTHWRLGAVADDSLFEVPQGMARQEVRREDLLRMLAAVFEYAVEATE